MKTLSAIEVAQIIVCILLIVMIVIGIIKICMNWYNSNNDDDGYDEMRNNIIATTLSNHENHKAEANERLRLDIAAQMAAALITRTSHGTLTFEMVAEQSFIGADALINRWKKDKPTKSGEPFVRGEDR